MRCEVEMGDEGYIVDLTLKECSYGYWQLSGLPCCHAVSAISHLRKNPDDYVHPSYLVRNVEECYKGMTTRNGAAARRNEAAAAARRNGVAAARRIGAAANPPNESQPRQRRGNHCSKCGSATHNARTCPLNRGVGIQDVRLNVGDRFTIERELRQATRVIGVYVDETTGNQYVRLNGANGRFVGNPPPTQPTEMDMPGSQPPPTQP
ncbi:unnamed protein product [Linum trigynum]